MAGAAPVELAKRRPIPPFTLEESLICYCPNEPSAMVKEVYYE